MGNRCCCSTSADAEDSNVCIFENTGGGIGRAPRPDRICLERCQWDFAPQVVQTMELATVAKSLPGQKESPMSNSEFHQRRPNAKESPHAEESVWPEAPQVGEVRALAAAMRWREAYNAAVALGDGKVPSDIMAAIRFHAQMLPECYDEIRWQWWRRPAPEVMGQTTEWFEADASCFETRLDRYCVCRGQVWQEKSNSLVVNVQLDAMPIPASMLLAAMTEVDMWNELMDPLSNFNLFADVLRTYGPRDRLVAMSFQLPLAAVPRLEMLINRVEVDLLDSSAEEETEDAEGKSFEGNSLDADMIEEEAVPEGDTAGRFGRAKSTMEDMAWPPGFLSVEIDPTIDGLSGSSWRGATIPPNAGTTRCSRRLTIFAEIVRAGIKLHIGATLKLPSQHYTPPVRDVVNMIRDTCVTTYHLLMHVAWQNDHPLTGVLNSRMRSDPTMQDFRARVQQARKARGWPDEVSRPVLPPTPTGKCEREGCRFTKHPYFFNNGGRHCCRRCAQCGKHGKSCQRRFFLDEGPPGKIKAQESMQGVGRAETCRIIRVGSA
mmetsp:Transcript_43513/g.100137  ORF Transcript_43513/g.100137 Transcript_43513/m.100137 type:complete len:547 (-) Transcript_43513:22-1662(-)